MNKPNYKLTIGACCLTSVTQAITLNLSPLFFVVFNEQFGISLTKIALLISMNFMIQIFMIVGQKAMRMSNNRITANKNIAYLL